MISTQIRQLYDPVRDFLEGLVVFFSRKPEERDFTAFLISLRPKKTNFPLVRIGPDSDGGYLVPDDLSELAAVFSPGVEKEARFELFFAERGVPCYLIDYSIQEAPLSHKNIFFSRLYLGSRPAPHFITLEDWVARNQPDSRDLLLQMDIEGGEWDVLESTPLGILTKFRIMVIELHNFSSILASRTKFKMVENVFEKLLSEFAIVHIHANNCCRSETIFGIPVPRVVEMTLIRRDRVSKTMGVAPLPHALDRKNVDNYKDASLPDFWM